MCTVHKLTHLFGTDVINTTTDALPSNYFLWNSNMTKGFSDMTNSFLQSAIESEPLSPHAELLTSMSIKAGGLGLQHPRTCAVTQFMLTTKRCLQYCHDGVWLGYNKPRPRFPHTITHLFNKAMANLQHTYHGKFSTLRSRFHNRLLWLTRHAGAIRLRHLNQQVQRDNERACGKNDERIHSRTCLNTK